MSDEATNSLSKFLRQRGLRPAPALTEDMIIEAAKKFQEATGKWPGQASGDASKELGFSASWKAVDASLRQGHRGLPGRSSLAQLLKSRGLKDPDCTPEMLEEAAQRYYEQHGEWPSQTSSESPREVGLPWNSWKAVDNALRQGLRGL